MQKSGLTGIAPSHIYHMVAILVIVCQQGRDFEMARKKPVLTADQQLDRLRAYGVAVESLGGQRWQAKKGECTATLEAGSKGLQLAARPSYLIGSETAYLLDGGYQKFWVTPGGKAPARAEQLLEMHAFQEALSTALGFISLYNESLGTVSERYHYDRVRGRPNP